MRDIREVRRADFKVVQVNKRCVESRGKKEQADCYLKVEKEELLAHGKHHCRLCQKRWSRAEDAAWIESVSRAVSF